MQYIAFDFHKRYTWALVEDERGRIEREGKVPHARGSLREFLKGCEPGSPVAVETVGNWYWIVDEIEAAGLVPRLVHAGKARVMSGCINKTDKLDVRGLNRLQRSGTLPTVWTPPRELRDLRDLPRTRMVLVRQRTQLKNRIHATFAKYAITVDEVSDLFGVRGKELLKERLVLLPPQTRYATARLLGQLESLEGEIQHLEQRTRQAFEETREIRLIQTLPGVGFILGTVITLEVGDVSRFPSPDRLASYAGMTPRVHGSGGKNRYGRMRPDVNRYLKWAYVEAANAACRVRRRGGLRHVDRLYDRIVQRRGHQKAVGAVGRHLAEATYWVLRKGEPYRDPALGKQIPEVGA